MNCIEDFLGTVIVSSGIKKVRQSVLIAAL
jgi:hypothetical protein